MSVLNAQKVCVKTRGKTLISNISVSIQAGEILAIVGPNGAGKTTFLRTVTGELKNDEGYVELCGHSHQPIGYERAKCVAVLPQSSTLSFPYTVEEVVALGRIPHSTGYRIDRRITQDAIAAMDLCALKEQHYTELSGGEKQRTQLARVLAQIWRSEDAKQRLLLLDEPAAALDLGHQQLLMQTVARFANEGVAIMMVVHDINLAAKYADKILAMKSGHCVSHGRTCDVLNTSLLRELFDVDIHLVPHPITQKICVVL